MFTKSIKLLPYLITICIISNQGLIAQENWHNYLWLDTVGVIHANSLMDDFKNTTLTVKDSKFGTPEWETISFTEKVENRLSITEHKDVLIHRFIEDGDYFFDLKVEFWKADDDPNGPPCAECTVYENMKVTVRNPSIITPRRAYQDAHKMKVTVLNTPDLSKTPRLRIFASIFVRRFY